MSEGIKFTNTVDQGINLNDFIKTFDAVNEICKQSYCAKQNEPPITSSKALGHDLPSCQSECATQKKSGNLNKKEFKSCYSDCHKTYSGKSNKSNVCEKKCNAKKNIIEEVTKKQFDDIKSEKLNQAPEEKLQEYQENVKLSIDSIRKKALIAADEKKEQQMKNVESIAEKLYLNNIEVSNKEIEIIKENLSNVVKEVMEGTYKSLDEIINKFYAINTICKQEYCTEQIEGREDLKECNLGCELENMISPDPGKYKQCQTDCKKKTDSKKQKCEEECNDKKNTIENMLKEYNKEIKEKQTTGEKITSNEAKDTLFNKVKEIMEKSNDKPFTEHIENIATMEESAATYGTELLVY